MACQGVLLYNERYFFAYSQSYVSYALTTTLPKNVNLAMLEKQTSFPPKEALICLRAFCFYIYHS